MPRVSVGDLALNYVEHGSGDNVVLAVHGNLGCADWLDLVLPLLPDSVRVIAAEWRGCGDSDKPAPAADYSNYSMRTHAGDMLALLDALGVSRCHLYGHSTGGIICSHMLAMQPERFGKVLMLDPVTPLGLELAGGQMAILAQMKADRDLAFAGLASAAPSLFQPETLVAGQMPKFSAITSTAQQELFTRIVERTRVLSDGIWIGTPHNLALEWESKALAAKMPQMTHEHLVLYGKHDYWIPREHVETMAAKLPNCRLEVFPLVGHSMCLEVPFLLAWIMSTYFLRPA
ncbi:MAG TPA: alpha/beta hydrolase [Burkholderiales bacterium]|nr:alpha/beta hydrolase [Burkholderiales bacterium]